MKLERPRIVPVALPAVGSEAPRRHDRALVASAIALAAAAGLVLAFARAPLVRQLVPAVFAALAVGLIARRLVPGPGPGWRGVRIDEAGRLALVGAAGGAAPGIDLTRPFGVTWLADRDRTRAALAVTGEGGAVYLAASFGPAERRAYRELLGRAATLADEEPALDAVGPDGAALSFEPRTLARLDRELLRIDPSAEQRCLLSDTRGGPVQLDGDVLRVGAHAFDLSAPLEWRAMIFQEAIGPVAPESSDRLPDARPGGLRMFYQGTWIRQEGHEAILVALVPSLSGARGASWSGEGTPEIERAVLRDLRLARAALEGPPPRDLRVGIERAYMLRLRVALDRAPRGARTSASAAS